MNMMKALVVCCLSALALPASADESGWYMGLGAGVSKLDLDQTAAGSDGSSTVARLQINDEDTGWKLFGGYRMNKYWAGEMSYVDLGKASGDVLISYPTQVTLGGSSETNGFALSGLGSMPIAAGLSVYGRLGLYRWDTDASALVNSLGELKTVTQGDNGTDVLYGVGMQWEVFDSFGARVEWEHFNNVADDENIDFYSVNAFYRF